MRKPPEIKSTLVVAESDLFKIEQVELELSNGEECTYALSKCWHLDQLDCLLEQGEFLEARNMSALYMAR